MNIDHPDQLPKEENYEIVVRKVCIIYKFHWLISLHEIHQVYVELLKHSLTYMLKFDGEIFNAKATVISSNKYKCTIVHNELKDLIKNEHEGWKILKSLWQPLDSYLRRYNEP